MDSRKSRAKAAIKESLLDQPDLLRGSVILKNDYNSHKAMYFFCFFALGIIVNLGYCTICTSAQDLAQKFGFGNEMALFNLSLIVCSVAVKFINSKWSLGIQHKIKIIFVGVGWTVGYSLVVGASYCHDPDHPEKSKNGLGFGLSIAGALVVGAFTGLADCTTLGFMKVFPSMVVSGYNSGIGMAALFGTFYYMLLNGIIGLSTLWIYVILCPFTLMYVCIFLYLVRRRTDLGKQEGTIEEAVDDVKNNKSFTCKEFTYAFRHVGKYMVNITAIYILDYMCVTSFVDRAWRNKLPDNANWWEKNAYTVLYFSKTIAVFITMSTLVCFKFPWVTLLTILQGINFVLWAIIAVYPGIVGIWWQIALMVWIGVIAGFSASNCMYYVLSCDKLTKNQLEVTVNIQSMFSDAGIFFATVSALVV